MVTSPGPAFLVFPVSLQVPGSLRGAAGSRVGAADRAATARRAALDAAARELDNRGEENGFVQFRAGVRVEHD